MGGIPMSAVCVNIADPDENIIFATCLLTNNTGCYGIIYTLEQNASPGIYNVTAESYEYDVEAYTTFEVILHPDNHPPFNPSKPDGPTEGLVGEEYMFSTNTVDPDEDQIQYGWDWDGDMLTDEWTDLHSSGENITTPHIWDKTGEL
ncbi:MAG: hypothetical protein DRN05_02130 [Thermoplasmata archaeon]|nr:MAG: hypothetical protein DRN05_02130 [Thermoplasmata archaeon]